MTAYLIRRFFQMVVVLLVSTIVIFLILSLVPGGPLDALRQNTDPRKRPSANDIQRIEKALGLDKPWYLRYVTWLAGDTWLDKVGLAQYKGERRGLVRGDWGTSWKLNAGAPVMKVIGARLPDTLRLMISATLLSIIL